MAGMVLVGVSRIAERGEAGEAIRVTRSKVRVRLVSAGEAINRESRRVKAWHGRRGHYASWSERCGELGTSEAGLAVFVSVARCAIRQGRHGVYLVRSVKSGHVKAGMVWSDLAGLVLFRVRHGRGRQGKFGSVAVRRSAVCNRQAR